MRCCPSRSGGAKDFATALTDAFRAGPAAALAGVVRVVPMERINAVLVSAPAPLHRRGAPGLRAGRAQPAADRRGWNVYYLQNSQSNDVAYVLQQAFTPDQ